MKYFLAKTEPGVYSIDDLRRDGQTVWDGVRNPQAVQAIRQMSAGDRLFIYHSGGVSAVVGLAEVTSEARPDPKNARFSVVEVKYLAHLDPETPLAEIKASGEFNDWALVRQGRLSTMAVPNEFVHWLRRRYRGTTI